MARATSAAKAANRAATSKRVVAAQKAQGQRQKQAQNKKRANAKTQQKARNSVQAKVTAFRNQAKKGVATADQIDKQSDKIRQSEKSRVVAQLRMDHKTAKTQQWAAKKKTLLQKVPTQAAAAARRRERRRTGAPSPANQAKLPENVSPTKHEKNNVRQQFQAAKQKFDKTQGIPKRGDPVTVGPRTSISFRCLVAYPSYLVVCRFQIAPTVALFDRVSSTTIFTARPPSVVTLITDR